MSDVHISTTSEIILDSLIDEIRVTCFRITFPRIVNAELLRHRACSFCSSSSRAIPIKRMIEQFCTYIPHRWSKHDKGMQPKPPVFRGIWYTCCRIVWRVLRRTAIIGAYTLHWLGVSKEQANRVLEPFSYITVIVQGTPYGFENFFNLRCDETAQYEIRELAEIMRWQYDKSEPVERELHVPFTMECQIMTFIEDKVISDESGSQESKVTPFELIQQSAARCARTSYFNRDGRTPTMKEDIDLYERLVGSDPIHASPAEFPVMSRDFAKKHFPDIAYSWQPFITHPHLLLEKDLSGNLHNVQLVQYRKVLETQPPHVRSSAV